MSDQELILTLNKKAESLRHEIQKGKIFEDSDNVKVYQTQLSDSHIEKAQQTTFKIPSEKIIGGFIVGLFIFTLLTYSIYDQLEPNKLLFWSLVILLIAISFSYLKQTLRNRSEMTITNRGFSIKSSVYSWEKVLTTYILESFVSRPYANSITHYYIILGLNTGEIMKIEISDFVDYKKKSHNHISKISHAIEAHKRIFIKNALTKVA